MHAEVAGAEADLTVVGVTVFPDFGFGPGQTYLMPRA